jgi:hypothetical protein
VETDEVAKVKSNSQELDTHKNGNNNNSNSPSSDDSDIDLRQLNLSRFNNTTNLFRRLTNISDESLSHTDGTILYPILGTMPVSKSDMIPYKTSHRIPYKSSYTTPYKVPYEIPFW